jgi:GGDEF domain-containing protein
MIIEQKILIIDDTHEVSDMFQRKFAGEPHVKLVISSSDYEELKPKLTYDYYIIAINGDDLQHDISDVVTFVKGYLDFVTPFIVVFSSQRKVIGAKQINDLNIIPKPFNEDYMHDQMKNTLDILSANRSINDITHLPGTFVIDMTLRRKLRQHDKFVLVYLDIDKFKPYTDYYGLSRANELIAYLAKVIESTVRQYGSGNDFVGHVGGDDYALILNDYSYAATVCREVTKLFDKCVPDFYEPADLQRGYITMPDRKGRMQNYGIISLTVAMVSNEHRTYETTEDVYRHIAKVKEDAKHISGTCILYDTQNIQING